MRIQPAVQEGVPAPSLLVVFDEICGSNDTNELLFTLAKWMNINFEEPTNLTSWVLVLNKLDAVMEDILGRSGPLLVLPERREDLAAPPPDCAEQTAFDLYALVIVLRFSSLLLTNSTNKDIYVSVDRLMALVKAYDEDISRLALECVLSLATPPPTQRCLTFTNHVTLMHKNASLCLPLFQIVEFGLSASNYRVAEFLSTEFAAKAGDDNLAFSMTSKSRHAQAATPSPNSVAPSAQDLGADREGKVLEIPHFLQDGRSVQEIMLAESWLPIEHMFPLLCEMRATRAATNLRGRTAAVRKIYQAILILLCCHPSSATLSDFFHDKTEILLDFIYLLRSGPGTPEYSDSIPFDIRVLACQSLVAVVGSRDVSSVSVMGRFSWLQHDLGVNRGQYMGLLPCLLRSAATFLASRHDGTYEYAAELSVAGQRDEEPSWADRVRAVATACTACDAASFSGMLLQTPPTGLMTVASFAKIKAAARSVFPRDSVVSASTLRSWILAAQDISPVYSADGHVQYSWTYLTRLLWTEQILILTTAIISATSALPALVDSGFIALIVGIVADPAVRDHTDLQLSYIEATLIQMLELSVSDSSSSMTILKEMNGADILLERLLFEIGDERFRGRLAPVSSTGTSPGPAPGSKRKFSDVEEDGGARSVVTRSRRSSASAPSKVGPGVGAAVHEDFLETSLRRGVHAMLPSTNVIIHSLLSALSIYLQEGGDPRLSHILRGKKFCSAMNILFRNSRYLAAPVFAFAYSILSEVINNDPGFVSYIINNGLVALALDCCKDLDVERLDVMMEQTHSIPVVEAETPLNEMLFRHDVRSLLCWPELTAELMGSMTSFISAVALAKDGLEAICAANPFDGLFMAFLDFRCYSPFSSSMMNDLPRSLGSSVEDLIRHYPVLTTPCMSALFAVMEKVVAMVKSNGADTCETITKAGVPHLMYLHATTGLLQCLNQALARKSCVEYLLKDGNGVPLMFSLLEVGMSAPRSFLSALAASTEPTTNSLGHHPIVKAVAQCFMSASQHEPRLLSEQLFQHLKSEAIILDSCLEVYWKKYEDESTMESERLVSRVHDNKLKNFLDSVSRKRLHQCYREGSVPPLLLQFTEVLRRFVVMNYLVENLAAILQILSSRSQSRYSAESDPFIAPSDCETLNTIINELYVVSQEELCAARGNLVTGNKRGKPKAHPIYRLLIISHEHVVVRSSPDFEGKKVCKLPKGAIVDAYERCTGGDNALKYRIKDGWIGFYRNDSYGDPQVEVIELFEKSPEQLTADETLMLASLDTPQKKFDFEKFTNVSPRRGGFMTMFHFHCCVRHLLSVTSWSFLPAPGKPFPEQTYFLLPLVETCLNKLLPDISYVSKTGKTPEVFAVQSDSVVEEYFIQNEYPLPDQFSISDSFRTIHAVELCHYLLFDDKKGHGETNVLLLAHLLHGGFIEKLLHASSLVFLTCLHPTPEERPLKKEESQPSAPLCADDCDDESPQAVDSQVDDSLSSDCGSDVDESEKRDWHDRRVLKERRMLAVTNIDIVIELWKLFFGSFSMSSHASLLLKESCDASHEFDISALKEKLYAMLVKYLFQTWSHPNLYSLPPTSVRHVLDLVNIISKTLWAVSHDGPGAVRGGRVMLGGRGRAGGSLRGVGRQSYSRGLPAPLQQLLGSGGMSGGDAAGHLDGNITISIDGQPNEEADISFSDLMRPRSNSTHSTGSRGRRRSASAATPSSSLVALGARHTNLPRLEHILPFVTKQTNEQQKESKELITELSTVVYNSVPIACLELISRGIKPPGVQWRTESALLNQKLTREDTTVMVLTMMTSCLEVTRWSDNLRSVVQMTSILEPLLVILDTQLTSSAASRLYGLLHALVLALTGSKFELMFVILTRSPRYCDFLDTLAGHVERKLSRLLLKKNSSGASAVSVPLWVTPALLILDLFAQPISLDKALLSSCLRDISNFIDPSSGIKYGEVLAKLLSPEFIRKLYKEFSPDAGITPSARSSSNAKSLLKDDTNDLELSSFIEKHGELDPSISAADIQAIRRSAETDSSISSDVAGDTSTMGSSLLPLVDSGLSSSLRTRCVLLCVQALDLCGTGVLQSDVVVQSVCQLLSHLTRERKLAELFQSSGGVEKLLNVGARFNGSAAFVYTLVLQVFEDDQYLLYSMESTIKVCLHRMKSSKVSKTCTFKALVEMLAPLIYRNQALFLDALKRCVKISISGGQHVISGVEDSGTNGNSTSVDDPTASSAGHTSGPKAHFSNSPNVTPNHGGSATPEHAAMKEILEVLVQKMLEQWLSACDSDIADESKPSSLLTIADTITVLGDLVCTVPGFATCIHKCQFSPSSKNKGTRASLFERAFSRMKHSMTGESLHSTHFITFLVHYLLSCDVLLQQSPTSSPATAASSSTATVGGIDTKVLKDAVNYLLVALVARPGDGRRRVLKEVLGVLRLGGMQIDTNNKIKVASALIQCIQSILNPKPTWKQRNLLTVPYKDIIMTVVSLKAYGILSEALFAISPEHPSALQLSEHISTPLEFLIRKGLPMYEENLNAEQENKGDGKDATRRPEGSARKTPKSAPPMASSPRTAAVEDVCESGDSGRATATERPPIAPATRHVSSRGSALAQTPGTGLTASGARPSTSGNRTEYDFFSPLVSNPADRRDTMTTDDDRELDRIEHHGTVENDLRLLSQPSQSSGPLSGGRMVNMPAEELVDEDEDDEDADDVDVDLGSILSSGSEDDDDDDEDDFDDEGDEDDDEDDDIVVEEDDDDEFEGHSADDEDDMYDDNFDDGYGNMDEISDDGAYDAGLDRGASGPPRGQDRGRPYRFAGTAPANPTEMEISISFEHPSTEESRSGEGAEASSGRLAHGSTASSSSRAVEEETVRLVSAAAAAHSNGLNGGNMRPPTRESGRMRSRHVPGPHAQRSYEALFDQADIDDVDGTGGYDSSAMEFDDLMREHDRLVGSSAAGGDNDDDGGGEWVTVNHDDDDGDDEYGDDAHLVNSATGSSGNRGRTRLSDVMENFYGQSRNAAGVGGGAVRIAGEDLMGFLGTLPIPDFLRDTLSGGNGSGGVRHMVAHIPMNGERAEHEEGFLYGMGGNEYSGGVRDALNTLMRPSRGQPPQVPREGVTSNPAPSRHPLVDVPSAGGRGRGQPGRSRGGSYMDAIISAVEGVQSARSDGRPADDNQLMKTIMTQRKRLLGSLISDRRWGTDVGDLEVTSSRLQSLGHSLMKYYDPVIRSDTTTDDIATREEHPRSVESAFRSQFGGDAARFGRRARGGDIVDESKEEMDLQESKEDSDSENDIMEGSSDESGEDEAAMAAEESDIATCADTVEGRGRVSDIPVPASEDTVTAPGTEVSPNGNDEGSNSTQPEVPDHDNAPASSEGVEGCACPVGYDPEVWASLPREVQLEVLGDQGDAEESDMTAMLDETELDRTALEALPAEMRSEILREEVVERRRRESFDQTVSSDVADMSGVISTFGSQIGADLQPTEGPANGRPSVAQENYLFITSLPPDLRQEALLGADNDFISSLPPSIREEAEALRERHQIHVENHSAETAGIAGPERRAGDNSGGSEEGGEAGDVYHRLYSQLLSGTTGGSHRRPGPRSTPNDETAPQLHPTTVFFEDDRTNPPPFGPRLVSRILYFIVSGTSTRLSRVLTRLLCVLCRYQSTRLPILRALSCILVKNADHATECLLQIPREPYKTYKICALSGEAHSLEQSTHAAVVRSEADDSLLSEMHGVAAAIGRANQVQGTLCVRRLLHLIGSLVKHTDRLVWFDIMNQVDKRSASDVKGGAVGKGRSKTESDWMFQRLISLLGDQRVIQECDIDSVLYLLGELCEPLSRLTVSQAAQLVSKQNPVPTEVTCVADAAASQVAATAGDEPLGTTEPPSKRRRIGENDNCDSSSSAAVQNDVEGVQDVATASHHSTTAMEIVADVDSTAIPDADAVDTTPADAENIDLPFPVLNSSSISLLAMLAKGEYCGGPGRNRLSRIMCTLSLYDGNWKQLVSSLSTAAEGLVSNTETECRTMLAVLTKVVNRNGSAADATSLPELSTPSSVSETRLLRVFRLMGSLRNSNDTSAVNAAGNGNANNSEGTPMTLSGTPDERAFVAEHIRSINFGSLWELLCSILDQIRGLEGINEEINAESAKTATPGVSVAHSVSSVNGASASALPGAPKQPFLSSLTMRFMPLIECYMTVSGATLLRTRHVNSGAAPESGGMLVAAKSVAENADSSASAQPPTPGVVSNYLRAPSSLGFHKVSIPGARFRLHKAFVEMHMDMIDGPEAARFLHFAEANKSLLNMILRQNTPLLESSFSPFVLIPRLRSLLHFDIKRSYFKLKLKKLRQSGGRNFGSLRISLHRSSVMEDSFQKLRFCSAEEMRKRLSVTFIGEDGIDAGGLTREWFSLLAKEIFNVNYCLFTATHDNVTFQPNPYSGINPDHLGYFKFVGRIIGKAICDGHLLDAHFTRSFYKHMLGIPVGYQDLEALEPEYFKSLMAIIEHPLELLGLDLTFSAELNEFGRVEVVDLIENGRNIAVTDENKGDYIRLIANHRMTNAIRKQIDSFLEGFHEMIPPELISIFDAQELELIISGLPDIDLDDLRAHTDYQGYKSTDPVINYFWSALRSFSKEEKALFLQFVTGTSKVPLDGFKALYGARGPQQFNIHKAYGTHLLPCAHTCFNQLDLPEYGSEEELREKMLIALHEGAEGFGFA